MAEETKPKRGRGRPKGTGGEGFFTPHERKPRVTIQPKIVKKVCASCHKEKTVKQYYKVTTPLCADGYFIYCKECTVNKCMTEDGLVNVDGFKDILRMMDKPFIEAVYDSAVSEFENKWLPLPDGKIDQSPIIPLYLKAIMGLHQYRGLNYAQGELQQKVEAANRPEEIKKTERKIKHETKLDRVYLDDDDDDFEVTRDIIEQFGAGFTKPEYKAMQRKYDFLSESYPENSTLHKESLTLYCKYRVKEEFAIMDGNADEAEKWAALASRQADKAKINPSQLTQSDLQNGVSSISELFMQLEQKQDILTVLPRFRYAPNDSVDFLIWEYINYGRRLKGELDVAYEDIWKFYDERKREYIKQNGDPYGIFKGDTTEKNRDAIRQFITVPKEFDTSGEEEQ